MEGRTLRDTRREARRFVETVVAGAFPDRPRVDAAGAQEVLEFTLGVRCRPGSRLTGAAAPGATDAS